MWVWSQVFYTWIIASASPRHSFHYFPCLKVTSFQFSSKSSKSRWQHLITEKARLQANEFYFHILNTCLLQGDFYRHRESKEKLTTSFKSNHTEVLVDTPIKVVKPLMDSWKGKASILRVKGSGSCTGLRTGVCKSGCGFLDKGEAVSEAAEVPMVIMGCADGHLSLPRCALLSSAQASSLKWEACNQTAWFWQTWPKRGRGGWGEPGRGGDSVALDASCVSFTLTSGQRLGLYLARRSTERFSPLTSYGQCGGHSSPKGHLRKTPRTQTHPGHVPHPKCIHGQL
jgi:hypothetical protein